jgi:hypothetical protein
MTAELSIADLLADMPVDPDAHLDPERVEHYLTAPAGPVLVFDTPEGLMLADGYHRLAAARRRGEATIAAEIRRGTREDVLRAAAINAAAQRGIGTEEALERIRRHGPVG